MLCIAGGAGVVVCVEDCMWHFDWVGHGSFTQAMKLTMERSQAALLHLSLSSRLIISSRVRDQTRSAVFSCLSVRVSLSFALSAQ